MNKELRKMADTMFESDEETRLAIVSEGFRAAGELLAAYAFILVREHEDHSECEFKYPKNVITRLYQMHMVADLAAMKAACEELGVDFEPRELSHNERLVQEILEQTSD
jgi:hypothetical protein